MRSVSPHQITVNSMRMIGIGLMGFLLAGTALLLSTMNILEQGQRYVREITTGPQLVFENRSGSASTGTNEIKIQRASPDHAVILSGFPAYQSVAFIMPVDARPTSGYLQIDATSQVLVGVEGVLRISIDNTRRGELLLRSGEAGRSLQIPLSPTDFAGKQLVVSFSLQGTDPQIHCSETGGVSAVVEIETTSAIYLQLDRPEISVPDRVNSWGNMARIAWPHRLQPAEQLRRLVMGTQLRRRGVKTVFSDTNLSDALNTADLRAAVSHFPVRVTPARFELGLAQQGSNAGVRRFHRQTLWRERYDVTDDAGYRLPNQLTLNMQLGRLIGEQHWAVTVSLNNRLVFQEHVSGSLTSYSAAIELPSEVQNTANTLEVAATVYAPSKGMCDEGPERVAELLPTSRLIFGDETYSDPLVEVQNALRPIEPINIALLDRLSAADANVASHLLHRVIPPNTVFKPAGARAHITVLGAGHDRPALPQGGAAWLVTFDGASLRPNAQQVTATTDLNISGPALLVTPAGVPVRGVEG